MPVSTSFVVIGGLGISVPVSLASHLLTSFVYATEHLVRSIVGFEIFELDSHFDPVSFNKQFHHQQLGVTLMKSLLRCLLYLNVSLIMPSTNIVEID